MLSGVTIVKDVIHYARRFVQIPSLSGEEKELAFCIREVLNEFGSEKVYIDELARARAKRGFCVMSPLCGGVKSVTA